MMFIPPAGRLLSLMLTLPLILLAGTAMAIEEPQYTVVEQDGDIELRRYESMIVAEVLVDGPMDKASGKGFRMIAGYIFGDNQSRASSSENIQQGSQKISMTAPVTVSPQDGAQDNSQDTTQDSAKSEKISMTAPVTMQSSSSMWRVHFVMPSEYTMTSLPKPNDNRVKLREIDAQNYAVIRFSGLAGEKKVAKNTQSLLDWLEARNIAPIGEPELARYNPPWTLPFMRRNEILVRYEN